MITKLNCEKYLNTIKEKAKKYIKENNIEPKLIIFNPNNDEVNQIYVRNKKKHLEDVGIEVFVLNNTRPSTQLMSIQDYFNDLYIDFDKLTPCLVQKTDTFKDDLEIIKRHKYLFDIEYINQPNKHHLVPTPNGIVNMLIRQEGVDFTSKHCVVANRSEIIGRPLVQRLLDENATVSICHSKTNDFDFVKLCNNADFIFSGVGKPNFIDGPLVKPNGEQYILDFGINRNYKGELCGDIDIDDIECYLTDELYYTPTPRGTGLTTIAQLIENVVEFYGSKPLWEVNLDENN